MSSEQDAVALGIGVQRAADQFGEGAENVRERSDEYVAKVREMKAEQEHTAATEERDFVPPERPQFLDVLDKERGGEPLPSADELLEKARLKNAENEATRQQSERPQVSATKRKRMTFGTSVDENTHDKSNDRDDYGLEL